MPLAVLLYWVSNNLWTLGQQYVVYRRIDVEESAKKDAAVASQQARAPRPGQKPVRSEVTDADGVRPAKTPGAKPVTRKTPASGRSANGTGQQNGTAQNGTAQNAKAPNAKAQNGKAPDAPRAEASREETAPTDGVQQDGARKRSATPSNNGSSTSRPPVRRGRKRR